MRFLVIVIVAGCAAEVPPENEGAPCNSVRVRADELGVEPWDCLEFEDCGECFECLVWDTNDGEVRDEVCRTD